MLTGRPGGTRARSVSSGSTRGRIAPTHVTTRPSTVPVRLSNHTGHSCVALAFVVGGGIVVHNRTFTGGCALVTLRVNTHLVYLVPVTKISTRTAVRIAGTTLFTTRESVRHKGRRENSAANAQRDATQLLRHLRAVS